MKIKRRIGILIGLIVLVIFLYSCNLINKNIDTKTDSLKEERLITITSEEQLRNILLTSYTKKSSKESFDVIRTLFPSLSSTKMTASVEEKTIAEGVDKDYSKTNVQVKGVDELDFVKTDGDNIYVISNNRFNSRLNVINAKELEILNKKNISNIIGLFVDENNIYIITENRGIKRKVKTLFGRIRNRRIDEETELIVLDKETLKEKYKYAISGSYVDSRYDEKNKRIIVITRQYLEFYLPYFVKDSKVISISEGYCINKDVNKIEYIVNVFSFDTNNRKVKAKSIPYSSFRHINIYMKNNIYVALSQRNVFYDDYEEKMNEVYIDLAKEVIKLNISKELSEDLGDILNSKLTKEEKARMIRRIIYDIQDYIQDTSLDIDEVSEQIYKLENEIFSKKFSKHINTMLLKLNLSTLELIARKKIPGYVLNQFSMDEYNNYFRVATTLENFRIHLGSNIYILDEKFNIIGFLEGIEKNEEIYAARFLGDKLYLVTFRRMDPFFVIDLSNPRKPRVIGKLKIPGYSTYLHPISENKILAIGEEESNLKISLYDTTNLENPKELSKIIVKGKSDFTSWNFDHHAFTIDEKHKRFFIPVKRKYYWRNEEGFIEVFKGDNKIKTLIIPNSSIEYVLVVNYNATSLILNKTLKHDNVRRTLYINNFVYTISKDKIKKWTRNNLEFVKWIKIGEKVDEWWPIKGI